MRTNRNHCQLPGSGWRTRLKNCAGIRLTMLGTAIITTMTLGACRDQVGSYEATSVLVQGPDLETVAAAVRAVGGEITHELAIINAVGAKLTARQLRRLDSRRATTRCASSPTARPASRAPRRASELNEPSEPSEPSRAATTRRRGRKPRSVRRGSPATGRRPPRRRPKRRPRKSRRRRSRQIRLRSNKPSRRRMAPADGKRS